MILASTFVVLIVCLGFSARLRFLLSIDDLIDPDFRTYASLKTVNENFHDHSTILLSLESNGPFQKEFLCRLETWILKTGDTRKDLIRITTSFGVPQVNVSTNEFRMPSSFDLNCNDLGDPEAGKIAAAFARLRTSPWKDILTLNPKYGITLFFFVSDPEDVKYGSINTAIVGELQKDFEKEIAAHEPGVEAYWAGVTAYQSYLRHAFDQTMQLNGLTYVIAWLLFFIFFGSWWMGTLFNITAIMTSLITYGFMGAIGAPIDSLSNAIGLMIMIACIEDFVFIAYGVQRLGYSLRGSLRHFLLPSLMTSLTTAIGFGSLITSDLGIVRRFGTIAAFAALVEFVIVFVTVPAAMKLFPHWKLFARPRRQGWKISVHDLIRVPRWAAWVLILLAFGCLMGLHKLRVNDSPAEFFTRDHIANRVSDHLFETRGWINEVSLLFGDHVSDERKREIEERIIQIPHIHAIESAAQVRSYLQAGLQPSDARLVDRIWLRSEQSKRLISLNGVERAQVYIDTMNMDQIRQVIANVAGLCPSGECSLVGSLISYNEYSTRVLQTLFSSLGVSLLLVSLIIFAIGRSQTKFTLLQCVLASAWGSLMLLGIFVVFDVPLFFVSCICASVLVGLAGDNAIQFILRSRPHRSLSRSVDDLGDASFIITLFMIGVTCVFLLSEMAPLHKLGWFMILGFILGYIGDVFILKGLQRRDH